MDIFLEYLVQKKATGKDALKKAGIVLLALLACIVVFIAFSLLGSFMQTYILLAVAGIIYGAVVLMRNFNLEYEYIFTNGELDVDVIKARKVRKRLASLHCKNIELMAAKEDPNYKIDFENQSISKRMDAVYDESKGNVYCVLFTKGGERTLLSFQPPEKLVENMKKFNPRAVHMSAYFREE